MSSTVASLYQFQNLTLYWNFDLEFKHEVQKVTGPFEKWAPDLNITITGFSLRGESSKEAPIWVKNSHKVVQEQRNNELAAIYE